MAALSSTAMTAARRGNRRERVPAGSGLGALGTDFGLLRLPRTFRRAEKVVARPPPTEESNLNTPSTRQRPAG